MLGWVVSSSDLVPFKGCRARLTISWEPGGSSAYVPLPCDDCGCEPIELYPLTERHAFFNQTTTGTGTRADITIDMITLVMTAMHSPTREGRAMAVQGIDDYDDEDQSYLGGKLLQMWRRGETTFYLAGLKYTWTYYSYMLPADTADAFRPRVCT